jgi:hypothetical protein
MVTVYTSTDPRLVALVEMALRDADVDYQVENANAAQLVMPTPAIPMGIVVRDEDRQTATRVIEQALRDMGEAPKSDTAS